ncbi:uncharacterized protein [Clytia hemisphaerica]|uniref:Transmembrane protein n=1 Tax=Clytia hemisphaerica TaxID=252671 RepID=A0A7M5UVU5_9CNID
MQNNSNEHSTVTSRNAPDRGKGILFKLRVTSVHVLYAVYATLLWLKLIDWGVETGHKKLTLQICMIVWMVVFVLCHCITALVGLQQNPHQILQQTWLNFPLLLFVVFTLPPYGFTLQYMYEVMDTNAIQNVASYNNITNCKTTDQDIATHEPMYDFILLQLVMLVMLLTFVIYPLPQRAYTYSEYIAVGMEFINAFDTMDMIGDLVFVRNYGYGWMTVYYLSLGVTAVLIAFPVKIEEEDIFWSSRQPLVVTSESGILGQSMISILDAPVTFETPFAVQTVHKRSSVTSMDVTNSKQSNQQKMNTITPSSTSSPIMDSPTDDTFVTTRIKRTTLDRYAMQFSMTRKKIIKASLTMIFTDAFFAMLRFKIMVAEQSAVHGFNMFVKNVILFCLDFSYLLYHAHSMIVAKLSLLLNN